MNNITKNWQTSIIGAILALISNLAYAAGKLCIEEYLAAILVAIGMLLAADGKEPPQPPINTVINENNYK